MLFAVFVGCLTCLSRLAAVSTEIPVEGIQDKQVMADHARFRVTPVEGYTYLIRLNDRVVPSGTWVDVAQPRYYELLIQRTLTTTGSEETRLIRFIVRASERGNSEWGLAPWTPFPLMPSAAAEFTLAQLRLWMPPRFPAGLDIPVIALVQTADGKSVPVNGIVSAEQFPSFQVRRGFGSGLVPASTSSEMISYTATVGGLSAQREVQLESTPAWISLSGEISQSQLWPENSRIHVVSNLVLSTDAILTIGAGTVLKLGPGVEIRSSGRIVVTGTRDHPVTFVPETRGKPWGGFVLRAKSAELQMTGAILTGGGAHPDWFGANPGSGDSHRHEQPLIYLANGARAGLTNCFLVDNPGQAAHGENAFLDMTDCLVQKCISTGQFNGGTVHLNRSAFIEFPIDDGVFADDDNDALYFTEGTHVISDCLIGWAKDDAIDSGSGGAGQVTVTGSWIESCFHEALAWSGTGRLARAYDTVILNCGQGVEAGWNSPDVLAERCLFIGNLIGARFGDNYDWTYEGFLRVTNSFLLFNDRNVWGRNWGDWTERLDRMDVRGNSLSAVDPTYPDNLRWTAESGEQLGAYLPLVRDAHVGVAFATRGGESHLLDGLSELIPVGLSRFSTKPVAVEYAIETPHGVWSAGVLHFAPGEIIRHLQLPLPDLARADFVQIVLRNPVNAEITGVPLFLHRSASPQSKLIATGSEWKYLDTGIEPGQDWAAVSFDDSAWPSGRAELGFGDGDEASVIEGGPSTNRHSTVYFRHQFSVLEPSAYSGLTARLRRDDGAVVYLNGNEVFRSNMPTGLINYATFALSSSTSETAFFEQDIDAALLLAGENVFAVELHQASKTSSDLSFDLELSGSSMPKLQFQAMPGGKLWLFWADEDFGLQEASAITGPWRTPGEQSSPSLVTAAATRFYRLSHR